MSTVPVRVRGCACPGSPHDGQDGREDGDVVYLAPFLSLAGGLAAEDDIQKAGRPVATDPTLLEIDADVLRQRWLLTYVRHGPVGWNLLDAAGDPVPLDVEVLLADYRIGQPVADVAADLYSEAVTSPLANRRNGHSRNGPKAGSTSPRRPSTKKRPKRSSRATSAGTRR